MTSLFPLRTDYCGRDAVLAPVAPASCAFGINFGDRGARAGCLPGFSPAIFWRGGACAVLDHDYRGAAAAARQKPLGRHTSRNRWPASRRSNVGPGRARCPAAVPGCASVISAASRSPLCRVFPPIGPARRVGTAATTARFSRRAVYRSPSGYWKLMASPERYRVYVLRIWSHSPQPG